MRYFWIFANLLFLLGYFVITIPLTMFFILLVIVTEPIGGFAQQRIDRIYALLNGDNSKFAIIIRKCLDRI